MGFLKGAGVLLALAGIGQVPSAKSSASETKTWSFAEFWVVPVRVHLLRADKGSGAGTKLTPTDVERIFRKVNTIWHVGGVHFWVESVVDEKAVSTPKNDHTVIFLPNLADLRPPESLAAGMFHVYYIKTMVPNGLYMQADAIFVKETTQLRTVPGGIDEPLPRVTSHELGHGMGLQHRQNLTNLMASGTTGTGLNAEEVETVRNTLATFAWASSPETFFKATEALITAGKKSEALLRYRSLLTIPGESPLKAAIQTRLKSADTKQETKKPKLN